MVGSGLCDKKGKAEAAFPLRAFRSSEPEGASGRSLKPVLGDLRQGLKALRIVHGDVGQDLAVDLDLALLQTVDHAAVRQAVQARGVDPKDKDQIISVLSMSFEPASDQEGDVSGTVILTLAGDGEIAARVECLDIRIMDMSQPWAAPSGRAPDHALGTDDS